MSSIDILKNKTILVGKEPVNGRLFVSVKINGQPKTAAIGEMNSVPNSVSRCKPAENIAHCKIEVDNSGNLTVTNLKPQNVTYVNGAEIVSKKVKLNAMLELGKDRYSVSINSILETASKIVIIAGGGNGSGNGGNNTDSKGGNSKYYSIKHLERVWNEYDTERTNEQLAEAKRNNIQKLGGICSSCGILFMFVEGMGDFRFVLTGLSVLIAIVFFIRGMNTSNSLLLKLKELDTEFRKKYICPNKDCKHFIGNIPYDVLRTNKKCPYCGCNYTEGK